MPVTPVDVGITSPITGGTNFYITITMDQAVTSDTDVDLSVSNSSVISGPKSGPHYANLPTPVTVPQGQSSLVVPLGSHTVSTSTVVTITASANGGSANGNVTVNP